MANRFLQPNFSTIQENQLAQLSKNLQTSLASDNFYTQEQYLEESVKVLSTFYKSLNGPILDTSVYPLAGTLPNSEIYNKMFSDIKDNLDVLFLEFENVEDLVVAIFNFAVTGANRLNANIQRIASLLGDYSLYNNSGDILLVRDSFDNTNKIELGSSLLNDVECSFNADEGIITLPVDTSNSSVIKVLRKPYIKEQPGALRGNNYEVGVPWNGDIASITDNNADTWFEYERVVRAEDDSGEALTLDVLLQFEEESIINFIKINPNNFGTRFAVKINTLETSIDGNTFTSIKDDILFVDYLGDDADTTFNLAPSTSKYAGQGLYTFLPRKAKYVHCIFSQPDSHIIETNNGQRLRYAIGIRDIEVHRLGYLSTGEIISRPFDLSKEVSKVAIRTTQYPHVDSDFANVNHFISVDNGASWHQIQPQESEGEAGLVSVIPEILNFNNADIASINTSFPVDSLLWKMNMSRVDKAFNKPGSLTRKDVVFTSEIHNVPSVSPHKISLSNTPIKDSVKVVDPAFGSRGIKSQEHRLSDNSNENEYFLPTEWSSISPPFKKTTLSGILWDTVRSSSEDWVHVFVNGREWTQKILGDSHDDFSDYDIEDEVYSIDWDDSILYFGDGVEYGKDPGNGRVSLRFDAERIYPILGPETPVRLAFSAAPDKKLITIKRYDEEIVGSTLIPRGDTAIKLKHKNITSVLTTIPGTQKTFVNGQDEFTADNQWSINTEAGYLYLSSPDTNLVVISYMYQPIYTLQNGQWDWSDTNILRDSISISDDAWRTISNTFELNPFPVLPSGYNYVLHLPHQSIIKKTLVFDNTVDSGINTIFTEEVPFQNGLDELNFIAMTTETIPSLSTTPVATFSLTEDIVSSTLYSVSFDSFATTYFTSEKSSPVVVGDDVGTYYINRADNEVEVRISSTVASPGKITYYYNRSDSRTGLYSVDYSNGRIFTQVPFDTLSGLVMSYEYADYRVEYPIARLIDDSDYSVDYLNGEISFDSSEIILQDRAVKTTASKYEVSYEYLRTYDSDLSSLGPFFTPILKDYVLKLSPKE